MDGERGCIDEILDASPITLAGTRSEANDVLQKFMRSGMPAPSPDTPTRAGFKFMWGLRGSFPVEIEAHITERD